MPAFYLKYIVTTSFVRINRDHPALQVELKVPALLVAENAKALAQRSTAGHSAKAATILNASSISGALPYGLANLTATAAKAGSLPAISSTEGKSSSCIPAVPTSAAAPTSAGISGADEMAVSGRESVSTSSNIPAATGTPSQLMPISLGAIWANPMAAIPTSYQSTSSSIPTATVRPPQLVPASAKILAALMAAAVPGGAVHSASAAAAPPPVALPLAAGCPGASVIAATSRGNPSTSSSMPGASVAPLQLMSTGAGVQGTFVTAPVTSTISPATSSAASAPLSGALSAAAGLPGPNLPARLSGVNPSISSSNSAQSMMPICPVTSPAGPRPIATALTSGRNIQSSGSSYSVSQQALAALPSSGPRPQSSASASGRGPDFDGNISTYMSSTQPLGPLHMSNAPPAMRNTGAAFGGAPSLPAPIGIPLWLPQNQVKVLPAAFKLCPIYKSGLCATCLVTNRLATSWPKL